MLQPIDFECKSKV